MAEICHKLQSRQEVLSSSSGPMKEGRQVRPSPAAEPGPGPKPELFVHRRQLTRTVCVSLQMSGEVEDLQHLLNVALQHRDLLRNKQLDLSWENNQLEVLLQPGDSLYGHHGPLLVSQAPSTSVPPAADRGHIIIEAAHCPTLSLRQGGVGSLQFCEVLLVSEQDQNVSGGQGV